MNLESCESYRAILSLPLPRPSFLPPATLRLRITALACGAVRVTRTMRETFLDQKSDLVINPAPGDCEVTESEDAFLQTAEP